MEARLKAPKSLPGVENGANGGEALLGEMRPEDFSRIEDRH